MKKILILSILALNLNASMDRNINVKDNFNNQIIDEHNDKKIDNKIVYLGSSKGYSYSFNDKTHSIMGLIIPKHIQVYLKYGKETSDKISSKSNEKIFEQVKKECNKIYYGRKNNPSKSLFTTTVRDGSENYTKYYCHPDIPDPDPRHKVSYSCKILGVKTTCYKAGTMKDPGHPYPCTKSRPKYKEVVDYNRYNKAVKKVKNFNDLQKSKETISRKDCTNDIYKKYLKYLIDSDVIDKFEAN